MLSKVLLRALLTSVLSLLLAGCPSSSTKPDAGTDVDGIVDADRDLQDGDADAHDGDNQDGLDGEDGDEPQTLVLELSWVLTGGGPLWDSLTSVTNDPNGDAVFSASVMSTAALDGFDYPTAGWEDALVGRVSGQGEVLWARTAGGQFEDDGLRVGTCPDGSLVLAGSFLGQLEFETASGPAIVDSHLSADAFVWALDSNGDGLELSTQGTFDPHAAIGAGCPQGALRSMVSTYSNISGDYCSCAVVDEAGQLVHQSVDGDGGWVLAQATASSPESGLVTAGLFLASPLFGQGDPNQTEVFSGANHEMFVAKRSTDCALDWVTSTLSAQGAVSATAVDIGAEGHVAVAGVLAGSTLFAPGLAEEVSLTSAGPSDCFVAVYSGAGELQWVVTLGGNGAEGATAVALVDGGMVVVTGVFEQPFEVTTDGGTTELSSQGGFDGFLVLLDEQGEPVLASSFGGPGLDEPTCVSAMGNSVLVGGRFESSSTFGAGTMNEQVRNSLGDFDLFLAAFSIE